MTIKNIRKQISAGQPVKSHHVMEESQKVCQKMKGEITDDMDSEEENHIWQAVSMDLKDVKSTMQTLNDDEFDWSKHTSDGKQSNRNFKEWVDSITKEIYSKQKKENDDLIF